MNIWVFAHILTLKGHLKLNLDVSGSLQVTLATFFLTINRFKMCRCGMLSRTALRTNLSEITKCPEHLESTSSLVFDFIHHRLLARKKVLKEVK